MRFLDFFGLFHSKTQSRRRVRKFKPRIESLETRNFLSGSGTVIIDENFEDGTIDGFDEVPASSPDAHIAAGDSFGVGNKAYQITNEHDEFGAKLEKYYLAVDSIDVSFASKLPDGIPIQGVARGWAGLKQSRLFRSTGQPTLHNMQDALEYYRPGFEGPGNPERYEYSTYVENDNLLRRASLDVRPDQWYQIRYYAKFNTPGQDDGVWMVWVNGQLNADERNVNWSDTVADRIDGVWIGGNVSLGGDDPDHPFRRLIDDIKVIVNEDVPPTDNTGTNISPVASFVATPSSGTAPLVVTFDATGSYDPDGAITDYHWDFGDGTSATGPVVQKAYNQPGSFSPRLTVTDDGSPPLAATKTTTIVATSPAPAITVSDIAVTEGDKGTKTATFHVQLTHPSDKQVTVKFTTVDGTAVKGQDYKRTSGSLKFARGVTDRPISIQVIGDRKVEPDETFSIVLSNPTNAPLARASAVATIWNQDFPAGAQLRKADLVSSPRPGIDFKYYLGDWDSLPDFSSLQPVLSGRASNFTLSPTRDWSFGYQFTAYVFVPRDGIYSFSTTSDDGSRLWIGDRLVVDNDGLHPAQERSGTIGLKAGLHAIRVDFFERGGQEVLDVDIAGPGTQKQRIADEQLFSR